MNRYLRSFPTRIPFLAPIIFFLSIGILRADLLHVGSGFDYATITAAAAVALPGDTIFVHGGTYVGGEFISDLQGTPERPILFLADPNQSVRFEGGSEAWHLSDVAYLHIVGFEFTGQSGNGVNIDDGGTFDTPAHHITIENCYFHDMDASGNNDLLKLSGLDSFQVLNCRFANGSEGGSGIDMVGCHSGLFADNRFQNMGSNSIQAKGGTQFIRIERNTFLNGGERSINLGGSTGLSFFRPIDATFEAADIQVYSNVFVGSVAPIAYVGSVRVNVVNNTFWMPEKWVMRILQETVDPDRFVSCGENAFCNNIVVIDGRVTTQVNVGPNTRPETFLITNNLWYHTENSSWSGPSLPVTELLGIVGRDPLLLDPENGDFSIPSTSPAVGKGAALGDPVYDYTGARFATPPSIGAVEAGSGSSGVSQAPVPLQDLRINIRPNPTQGKCELNYTLKNSSNISINLFDAQGKAVGQMFEGTEDAGEHRHEINVGGASGTLLLLLSVDGIVYTSRIVQLNERE